MTPKPRSSRRVAYARWWQMIHRCTSPADDSWQSYGARGIAVCERWTDSFDAYYLDVGDCPEPHLSLDRINNDGDYEPGNVRWATYAEQSKNKRRVNQSVGKTHCPQGHPYDEANTHTSTTGKRACRKCKSAWQRAYAARNRAL